ncbi:MAG TPA: energy transducer TonB [Geothrix sp.]|nr:energy transducer TonB [Geothrix sp.]
MIRSAAFLLPACLLATQAPVAPKGPVRAVRLSLQGTAPDLDLPKLEADLAARLKEGGLGVLTPSEAAGQGAYKLDLTMEATPLPEGAHLLAIHGALERLTDLEGMPRDEEYRWTGASLSAHAAGQELPAEASRIASLIALSLLGKAQAARTLIGTPAPLAIPIPPSPLPKPVEVAFSKDRIQHQPLAPTYPPLAKAKGLQGTVQVIVTVDPEGHPVRAVVENGPQELRATALQYVLQWRFTPVVQDGAARWAWFRLPIPFRLLEPAVDPARTKRP